MTQYKKFIITRIGEAAGFSMDEMSPMFTKFRHLPNVTLPEEFL